MVRLIPVEGRGRDRGRIVWVEDSPDVCGNGHAPLRPGRGPCPRCQFAVRTWMCEQGCVVYDDDHACRV